MNHLEIKSFEFSLNIVKFCKGLATEQKEYIISKQLLKSGTAIGANYREAAYAESRADFIHKMCISQKECNETIYWLDILQRSNDYDEEFQKQLKEEATVLMKLISKTILTAKRNRKAQKI
ncbi:four helix bundle protein [Robertkochia flava]|uniref:four helix bundle protein n=1 Tax=Robertkochia flava TaxID=3447986 RepID=UPI001CCE9F72|nr:four helix bundle protein [Robertkochia marina]